ncbi:aldehyde dehydrogenase family protein [Sulfitobacter aestuariivivens]|uniref:Aldehyde dehydrogenase family protein n=1 Tax=Sulfitobacter aestuariivivens TaxID=2766981 RepID=A0A927DAM6_9RHOB|nr:aldehyde dehydrogenase family protein [Sulfitobacter aestuariivivens]MBD3666252.1 aldehyde dehydrogenase family protein [Sulfitobacter aestuariivivens]
MALLNYTLPTEGLAGSFIDGKWHWPDSGEKLAVENPSRREVICEIGRGTKTEIDLAVAAAERARRDWSARPASERGAMLTELGNRLSTHAEEIARVLAAESGNAVRTQSRGEAAGAAGVLKYYGGVAVEQKGETLPLGPGIFSYATREPLGVVGSIIPWNSPLQLGAVKISMALATGNCLVLKPAEDAPLAVLRLVELAADIFPPGVFNVVTGLGEEAGAALASHPGIAKVSFTGSSEVGKLVAHSTADRIANVTLELGGKSPCIIFPDACTPERIDATAQGVVNAMRFARQGQSCTAGSRLFVHASVWDDLMPRVAEKAAAMTVGDALDEDSDIGAVVNAERYDEICAFVAEAEAQGATFLTGETPTTTDAGFHPIPTILTGLDNSWRIAREEVFGPVLIAIPWKDEADMIALANDTHYGLAAFIFTHDMSTIIRMTRAIDAGWVQVNQGGGQIPGMSYGGIKQSGMGSEYSIEGALEAYTFRKCVTVAI